MRLEGARFQDRFLIKQLSLYCLGLLFLLLLPFNVCPYLFFTQSNGTHTVSSCPQVTPPLASPKTFILLEQSDCHFAFQIAHEFGHCIFRRYRHHQMHMVWLHIQFQYFNLLFLLAQLIHLLLGIFAYCFLEDSISILQTEHNMILALVQRM